jgi:hypothetical protein
MKSTADQPQKTTRARGHILWPALSLFVFALILRIIGFNWGLPTATQWNSFHPDESTRQIVGAVGSILSGQNSFNPGFFNYPSLTIYATWIIFQVMTFTGLTTPVIGSDIWPIIRDIIVAGRIFSVVCGAGTASLVFLLAHKLRLGRSAILAGVLAAIIPAHVQHSHFATVDIPATFFCVLCLYLCAANFGRKAFLGAAFTAGLAAGAKYNAGIVLVAPLVALWLSSFSTKDKLAFSLLSIIPFSLAFFITTPYALLDFPRFWGDANGNGFYFEAFVHPKIGSDNIFIGTGNGWLYHLTFNMPFAFGLGLLAAGLIGGALALKNRSYWPILIFCGLFFLSLGLSQVRFMRYVLPLAPCFAILAALAISKINARLPQLAYPASGVLLALTFAGCVTALSPFVSVDPRLQTLSQLPSDRPVGMIKNPWFYTPPFSPNFQGQPTENTAVTGFDLQSIRSANAPTFVISDFEIREEARLDPKQIDALFEELKKIYSSHQVFYNESFALPGRDFVPHDYLYTNPRTHIFRK